LRWPRDTLYPQKLTLTSPTSGCRSVGIVRSLTKATELSKSNHSFGVDRNIILKLTLIFQRLIFSKLCIQIQFVPHRRHIMSTLRAQQVHAIYRLMTMIYCYNFHNSGHYPSSCPLFKIQLNSIGFSLPHRKHITSPLRAQQVDVIYRFVTMVY
jgi:hypothetical protein